jgi:cardiolipin synthase
MNGSFAGMVSHARQSIYLTTPYFVPNRRTQRLLCEAAQRGVDVRLLVPRKHDIRLAQWAAHAAYEALLESGVRIFEYLPRLLHSKTTVVDAKHATVGTSNIDYRSFFLNYELNLFTHQSWLCERLRAVFLEDLQQSEEVLEEHWKTRFPGRKALELVGWLARRLL